MPRKTIEELTREARRSSKCLTCTHYPKVVSDVRTYLETRLELEGRCRLSYSALHREMVARHNYEATAAALFNHVRGCESQLHGQISKKGY